MATTTRSQLQGFKELDRVLKALPGRLAERELTSAVRAGARVIVKEARARARGRLGSPRGRIALYGLLISARRNGGRTWGRWCGDARA